MLACSDMMVVKKTKKCITVLHLCRVSDMHGQKVFFFVCCSCCSGRVKSASKRLTWQFTHCMTHISATRLGYLQISRQNFHVKWLFKLPHVLPELRKGKQTALSIPMAEQCLFLVFFLQTQGGSEQQTRDCEIKIIISISFSSQIFKSVTRWLCNWTRNKRL